MPVGTERSMNEEKALRKSTIRVTAALYVPVISKLPTDPCNSRNLKIGEIFSENSLASKHELADHNIGFVVKR